MGADPSFFFGSIKYPGQLLFSELSLNKKANIAF